MSKSCPQCNEPVVKVLQHDDPDPESSKRAWFNECSDCEWQERVEPDSD